MPKTPKSQLYCDAEINQLQQLVGGAIIGALDGGESFGFQVRTLNGAKLNVWVDCDPEGNGPGHLNIEPASSGVTNPKW